MQQRGFYHFHKLNGGGGSFVWQGQKFYKGKKTKEINSFPSLHTTLSLDQPYWARDHLSGKR